MIWRCDGMKVDGMKVDGKKVDGMKVYTHLFHHSYQYQENISR